MRIWNVRLNVDALNSAIAALESDAERLSFLAGFHGGLNGRQMSPDKTAPWLAGWQIADQCLSEAKAFSDKQRERVSKRYHGTTTVEPRKHHGTTTDLPIQQSNNLQSTIEESTNESLRDGVTNHAPRSKRFTPPTLEEVKAYCQERKNGIDAEQFMNRYESNGWLVGKSPMKNWQAAVRTWEKNAFVAASQAPTATIMDAGRVLRQDFPDALKWTGKEAVGEKLREYGEEEVRAVLEIAKRNAVCFDANEWREAFEGRKSDYGGWDFWKPRKKREAQ